MSHSPVSQLEVTGAKDPESDFRKNLDHVNRLMNRGGTLSGHERNCAFLNLRNGRFATVSSVTGFDFPDDARAVATVDWDSDGDVDAWVSNRTAPRLRFLRNDTATAHHWLSLRLRGTHSNRDAIGTRVQLFVAGSSGPITRTLRAGEGFLAQSSKTLHFGLGEAEQISRAVVTWPDGQRQEFAGLAVDRRYLLVEGVERPEELPLPQMPVAASVVNALAEELAPTAESGSRIPLTVRLPMPRLDCRPLDVKDQEKLTIEFGMPVLINLWSASCPTCMNELRAITEHRHELAAAKLDIVAVNVDRLLTDNESADDVARETLAVTGYPFRSGLATADLIERLRFVQDHVFGSPVEIATPTSFLIDQQGRLAVIYRGAIDVRRLKDDIVRLSATDESWMQQARPFVGRWNEPPPSPALLPIARDLMDRDAVDDAIEYVSRTAALMAREKDYGKLLVWLGDELVSRRRALDAIHYYQKALEIDPDDLVVMNNVAWQMATNPDDRVRDGMLAVRWSEEAARQTSHGDPNVLATLAASYAEAGRFDDAVRVAQRVLELATQMNLPEIAEKQRSRLELFRQHKPFRE